MCHADKGEPSFLDSVASLVEAAEQEMSVGDMSSFRILAAGALILAAASWQPKGKFSKAKALLATAMSHLHLAAKSAAIDLKANSLLFVTTFLPFFAY